MDIFNRSEDEILFELIERDNPGLDPKLTPQNCYISTAQPNTDTDADRYNTVATVVPRYGSGLYGRRAIKYNRIDLAELFRGMSPVKVQGHSANETYATRDELPAFIGETYGLPIRDGDVHASSSLQFFTKPSADYGRGVYKIDRNKCFIGQIYVAFSRDFTQSLSTLLKPPVLNALNLPAGIGIVAGHPDWPSTWGFFGDIDFTEIADTVNHQSNFTFAQATTIGLLMGRTFFSPSGGYDPDRDFDNSNPFGWYGSWATHVACDKVATLIGQYPWLNRNYTHVKITKLAVDPATNRPLTTPYYFALYFNWHDNV